uniref:SH3 domain-containing protein n=1 Tax=Macrostomum lignano TaxID=282301 RepID=A0A1I8IZ19_9PLAT
AQNTTPASTLSQPSVDYSFILFSINQKPSQIRTASDRRSNQFLTGWETGVDNQLTPPKAAYTVKPIARQQQQQPSFLNKTGGGIRSKPFVFVQSLSSEGYLKCYTNEHSYLANLYASGTQQQQQQLRQAPSISGFPVRLSSPPPFLSPPPPPQPRPQSPPPPQQAAARSGSAGSERVTRLFQQQTATSSAELEAAGSIGQQVDLVTKKIVPPSYFIIR